MSTAPSFDAFLEVAKGYKRMAFISYKLAVLMRKNGFAAYPGTALGGITDYTYLGELAGLGAIGYHGLLITPEEGARVRINTIYTNITNLPIDEKAKTNISGCAISAPCARNAFVNVPWMPSTISLSHGVMAACRPSIMLPAAIISINIRAVPFVWRSVPLVRADTPR